MVLSKRWGDVISDKTLKESTMVLSKSWGHATVAPLSHVISNDVWCMGLREPEEDEFVLSGLTPPRHYRPRAWRHHKRKHHHGMVLSKRWGDVISGKRKHHGFTSYRRGGGMPPLSHVISH